MKRIRTLVRARVVLVVVAVVPLDMITCPTWAILSLQIEHFIFPKGGF